VKGKFSRTQYQTEQPLGPARARNSTGRELRELQTKGRYPVGRHEAICVTLAIRYLTWRRKSGASSFRSREENSSPQDVIIVFLLLPRLFILKKELKIKGEKEGGGGVSGPFLWKNWSMERNLLVRSSLEKAERQFGIKNETRALQWELCTKEKDRESEVG